MIDLRPYNAPADKRSGTNAHRHGCCSSVWCRADAVVEWTTNGGKTRYACEAHHPENPAPEAIEPDEVEQGGLVAAGAGDGRYHDAPFLKKYGA